MNTLPFTEAKVAVRPAPLPDFDCAYGCVEWYLYPQAAAESPAADACEAQRPPRATDMPT